MPKRWYIRREPRQAWPQVLPREDIVLLHGQEALHDIQARETLLSRFNHALHRLDEASQELDLGRYTLPVHLLRAQRPRY